MGYLNDLTARTNVNWQRVKLAHDQWSYSQEGLTPAGAALLGVAVAWATGGMLGTTGTATSAMANAAFTSLASQASITLINNKGDIGKTLKDMSSSSTVKATLAAVITAWVLDKLGSTSTMEALRKSGGFSDKLTFNLINVTGRALTNTGQPIIFAVSLRTETISSAVWDIVTSNGKVIRYDPVTGIKTKLMKRPGA